MSVRVWLAVFCFAVVCSVQPTSANDQQFEKLVTLLTYLKDMLRWMESQMLSRDNNLQDILKRIERKINSTDDHLLLELKAVDQRMGDGVGYLQHMLPGIVDGIKANGASMGQLQDELKALLATSRAPVSSCRAEPSKVSGTYRIQPGYSKEPFEVYCEQTAFGGGWIVVQRRFHGTQDFYRNWTDYRDGFGSLDGEFWLGLERLHQLTGGQSHELILEMKDADGNYGYAHYDAFAIDSEDELYRLKVLGEYYGTAGDALTYNKGSPFSTPDRDNDAKDNGNCAVERHAGWWFRRCTYANLNGLYQNAGNDWSSMSWYHFKNDYRALVSSRMMIREKIPAK